MINFGETSVLKDRNAMKHKIGRNQPCPCGSGRKYKHCCMQQAVSPPMETAPWVDDDGLHFIGKGAPPTAEDLGKMTREYQKDIRNSPLWNSMVEKYGEEKAERLLKEFQVRAV